MSEGCQEQRGECGDWGKGKGTGVRQAKLTGHLVQGGHFRRCQPVDSVYTSSNWDWTRTARNKANASYLGRKTDKCNYGKNVLN